jgi:translocation and assembly module TamB
MRILRALLIIVAAMLGLAVAAIAIIWIGLNCAPGRAYALQKINQFAGPGIKLAGLAGHFPADIKLGTVQLADADGVWASAQNLELRWTPLALLHRDLDIQSFTAGSVTMLRAPAAAAGSSGGGGAVPDFHADIARLDIAALSLPAGWTGNAAVFHLSGSASYDGADHVSATLAASATGADYRLVAAITPKTASLQLHLAESPNGPAGHFLPASAAGPLNADITLTGPRNAAALTATASLGKAALSAAGTVALTHPAADLTLTIPALTPFATIAGQPAIAGSAALHLIASQQPDGIHIALRGAIPLTAGPDHVGEVLGTSTQLALIATWQAGTLQLGQLALSGDDATLGAAGSVGADNIDLNVHLGLPNIAPLSPGRSGPLQVAATVSGRPDDFAISAFLTGDIADRAIPSGPFTAAINVTGLPHAPAGTLTASGALENAPLMLDAAFTRAADGSASVTISNAFWRSLSAHAQLSILPGKLPTGTADFAITNLDDFSAFSPVQLAGRVSGKFGHPDGRNFTLSVRAANLLVAPALGRINGTIDAAGPPTALAVQASASIAHLAGNPADIALIGTANLPARSATLATLTAHWHRLNFTLDQPAEIAAEPLAVHHLAATLNGGRITADGTIQPKLDASLTIAVLPANLAKIFDSSLDASGTLAARAHLTGTLVAPAGALTLSAQKIRLHNGPGAALPAADFAASATLNGAAATLTAQLNAGPHIAVTAAGTVPETLRGPLNLHVTGSTDLLIADPILAAAGSVARGELAADMTITATPTARRAAGAATLTGGSFENIDSGLNLTHIAATLHADGPALNLTSLTATAGAGTIDGHGTINLDAPGMPLDISMTAHHATPVSSDTLTETVDAALTLTGALHETMALAGSVEIEQANINIPRGTAPDIATLPILIAGAPPPPPPPPAPPITLDLSVSAKDRIFVRGDGLFAELGGRLRLGGTAAHPVPAGGFTLIRGEFSLAGRNLQFTSGTVTFNGDGFVPSLDLEATATNATDTATLVIGGTAEKPTITLTSTPPLPSDEILAQLLFDQSTTSLTPFQAASLAAALAQLAGIGGGGNPLDTVRQRLGLDELSLGGSGTGPPSVQAGRYVAPGIYVGASQATNGQGTQANVEINLAKGLKLDTATGTSGGSASSSVGLSYQFNY